MTAPVRIQRRRAAGWRMPESAVYVGRGSRWGNWFRVVLRGGGRWAVVNGTRVVASGLSADEARTIAVARFRDAVMKNGNLREQVPAQLRGRDLACWCRPGEPCHADVLLEIANATKAVTP